MHAKFNLFSLNTNNRIQSYLTIGTACPWLDGRTLAGLWTSSLCFNMRSSFTSVYAAILEGKKNSQRTPSRAAQPRSYQSLSVVFTTSNITFQRITCT